MNKLLKDNYIDKITALTKGLAGTIPIGGSLISEIVGTLIPNQRIDRLAKYMQMLEDKLSSIPLDRMNELLKKPELIDLLEDGFFQASRASSDERREYISQIILNGIDENDIKYSESRALLRLLGEITDVEVIWLRYYANYYTRDFKSFWDQHEKVLRDIRADNNSGDNRHREEALQVYCRQHLERIGLLAIEQSYTDRRLQYFLSRNRAEVSPKGYSITKLGLVLLKQLGLVNNINHRHLNTFNSK